jgi:integrase
LSDSGKSALVPAALAAIDYFHAAADHPSPRSPRLRLLVDGAIRQAAASRVVQVPKDALPVDALRTFVVTDACDPVIHARDAALVAVGLRTMRRPGELAALNLSDITFPSQDRMVVYVKQAKNDQLRRGHFVTVDAVLDSTTCPVQLMRNYLILRGQSEGPLFLTNSGLRLSVSAISSIVKRVATVGGASGDFTGRSLRVGGATAALTAGWSSEQIKSVGGWSSDAVALYFRTEPLARMGASRAMGF